MIEHIRVLLSNPVYGGMISLWFIGITTYLCKNIPSQLFVFVKNQLTTSIVINDSGYSNIIKHYTSLLKWALKQKGVEKFCRNYSIRSNDWWGDGDGFTLGIGYGYSFFIYKKRLFCFHQQRLDSTGSEKEKSQITITGFTRNKKYLEDIVEEFRYKKKSDEIYINRYSSDGWETICPITKRPISTVIMKKELKEKIIDNIQFFIDNKDMYINRGLPYKKTIVLYGNPGTGKTSIIKALASHFNKNVYIVNIMTMSNTAFEKSITSVPANSVIIIEDFDSCSATHSRNTIRDKTSDPTNSEEKEEAALSLNTILNTLDGVVSLNGTIIFMTTNHIEKIDSALLRKGRTDEIYEIPYLTDTEIKDYIKLMFPEKEIPNVKYSEISGCDIQSKLMESKYEYEPFIKELNKIAVNDV